MCGIAGVFLHERRVPDPAALERMAAAMVYRGPDDQGVFHDEHVGLVHRRLSIRDLSPAGHCPMATEDGAVQVVFNGEIYNWRELREELEAGGCRFHSQSDTEVLLQGYRTWGLELPRRLRGMFAFAIWDASARRLFVARDRAGEKPLFYRETAGELSFASSPGSLLTETGPLPLDPVAIASHLSHSFIPASHTAWVGVRTLPPAHYLVIEPGRPAQVERYWDFPRRGPDKIPLSLCERAVEETLDDCVTRCLDADVPVGVFLSGGVDSSLIAALAARRRPGIPAFSLGFAETDFSELPFARRVAEHLDIPHHVVEITADDVLESLPHLVKQYGQPFGDASAVPSYCVARLARSHVKVCLTGDGGDESFGGYWRMQSGAYAARYGAWLPRGLRTGIVPRLAPRLGRVGRQWMAMNDLSLQSPGRSYTNSQSWYERMGEIAGPALTSALRTDLAALRVGKGADRPEASVIQNLLYDDFQVQLPDAYLTKVDVASMAASLEARSPFLDPVLLELAWSLPDAAKLNWGRRKWLLKRIAARHVPRDVVYRPKMGFAMPLPHWFRGKLGNHLEGLLEHSVAADAGWIRVDPVRRCLDEHRNGKDHTTRLWLVLWLEEWFRIVAMRDPSGIFGVPR